MANVKKILMVDDDVDLREALADSLVLTEEFDVFEADTGSHGLEKAREAIYDLVILDVGLPDMDGAVCPPDPPRIFFPKRMAERSQFRLNVR